MSTDNIVWIVIAAVAVIAIIAVLVMAMNRAKRRRQHRQAEEIREQARLETAELERREALANETAAKARAAQAEAEVRAAEAARLQEQAAEHQHEATTSRDQLREKWEHADSIDPTVRTGRHDDDRRGDDTDLTQSGRDEAWHEESAAPANHTSDATDPNYRPQGNYRGAST